MLALRHRLEVRGGSSDRVVISGRRDRGPRVEVYARVHRVHRARASRAVVRGRVVAAAGGEKSETGNAHPTAPVC
jgi:hypothetical protein